MSNSHKLVEAFAQAFSQGSSFKTINEARQLAQLILSKPITSGTSLAKLVEESIERGLVRAAHLLVNAGGTPKQIYERLVDLYHRQPTLGTRSSTSVAQQAYSTPLPIAYLASQLARITSDTTIYEPAAGHGALLLNSTPARVFANEINPERADELTGQGYIVTQYNAATYLPEQKVDVVILNPPFGSVQVDGKSKVFVVPEAGIGASQAFTTTQIDYAIALNALKAMKADGTAALILGGKMGDEQSRSKGYNSQMSRNFYYCLYQQYNVTKHFSIDGKLYSRQGAGFPIDVILIAGRGKSRLSLPAAEVPKIYCSFNELKEMLSDEPVLKQRQSLDASFNRTDGRGDGSGVSTTGTKSNIELWGVPRPTSDASDLDDQTRRESVRGIGDDQPLHQSGRNVLPSFRSNSKERTTLSMGDRLNEREPLLPTEAELRIRNQFPSTSNGESRGTGNYQANTTGRVATNNGLRTTRGMDVAPLKLQETITMPEPATTKATTDIEQPRQVRYIPLSHAQAAETLVPTNMQVGTANALSRLQQQVGLLDEYVADRLNYGNPERLHQYLNAEQVDAVALAINNLEKGRGFIIGDQTGVGKGRVVACVIRYAKETGRIPIFVTRDPVLYADMMRDLSDIGMASFKPLPTNSDLNIPLPDGRRLKTTATTHKQEIKALMNSGSIRDYDAIFTTYSQMQSVKGKETERRHFLRAMAPKSIVIMDESHEAGGSKQFKETNVVPDRAEFAREILSLSQGAVYSSATFAKRPDVMDLYALTDMGRAVSTEKLVGLVERGGIPMQQGLATMLVQAGQYIRRERSYEGVSFDAKVSPVDKNVAESMSAVMAAILEFDRLKQQAVKQVDKELKVEAKSHSVDNSTGAAGVDSTNFTSIMHNLVDQSLLAMKAEATVQECLTALRSNEKPIIALASTMGSFIGDYAQINQLKAGEPINLDFTDLLKRYLERSRDILVKDYQGNKTRQRLTDEQLGPEGVAQYEAVIDQIDETDLSSIPISPIDFIKQRLQQEGYSVSEVTGRTETVNYNSSGNTTYSQRQTSKAADRNNIEAFNSGQIDVMILNRSGATGISLHASERFTDQRQRHMIVVQPEKDVNNFMQMLGRIHRTGQVVQPKFTLLGADIPAEKRPNAVLLKKMASLNANTTAARKSGINLDAIPDFLNEYGGQVVADILSGDPELNYKLASPLKEEDQVDREKLITKVTGRVPLLPLDGQEAFYHRLERDYQELVERQEAMGESILEANSLNLDARTIAQMEVIPPDPNSTSPFTSAVYLEVVDAKTPRKPLTTLEVANVLQNNLGLAAITEVTDYEFEKIAREARANVAVEVASLHRQVEEYRYQASKRLSSSATEKLDEKLDKQLNHVQSILQEFPVGERVRVVTSNQNVFYGVVGRVWSASSDSGNPIVPANWRMQLLLADQARELIVPLSKVNTSKENAINVMPQQQELLSKEDIYDLFDLKQTQQRQERQIFTGNILRAYEAFQGKLVNFTDNNGKIRQGVLTPQGFDIEKTLKSQPVRMPTAADTKQFITDVTQRTGAVKTLDELLTIKAERRGDGFILQAPKAKDTGGQYYLDPDILAATGADFYSVGDRMECAVSPQQIDAVLEVITKQKGLSLAVFEQCNQAREMLGIKLPKLEKVEWKSPQVNFISASTPAQVQIKVAVDKPSEPSSPLPEIQKVDNVTELSGKVLSVPLQSQKIASVLAEAQFQNGLAEKNVAKLLHQAGLAASILAEDDFYLKVENEPYIPLSIERHGRELYLTHYRADYYGDLHIDAEMVFEISSSGKLSLTQTAVQNPFTGGEHRRNEREFGKLFSKNLLDQGFAAAIEQAIATKTDPNQSSTPQTELTLAAPEQEQLISDRTATPPSTNTETTAPVNIHSSIRLEEASQKLATAFDGEVIAVEFDELYPKVSLAQPAEPVATNSTELKTDQPSQVKQGSLFEVGNTLTEQALSAAVPITTEIQTPKIEAVIPRSPDLVQASTNQERENLAELANTVRNFDLETVAEELGLERDQRDKHKWRGEGQILSINQQKFYNHLEQKGGYGAIDLVIHVNNCSYRDAIGWLTDRSATPTKTIQPLKATDVQAVKTEPKYLALPIKDETKWSLVRSYLVKTRGLPDFLVDALHDKDLVYADSMNNAVFLRHATHNWRREEQTGANMRGTSGNFHGLSAGTDREKGWFLFTVGHGQTSRVVLTESAIDAMSLAALDKINGQTGGKAVYLSADGAGAVPINDLKAMLSRGGQVELAFDADAAGDAMAEKLLAELSGAVRVRPEVGKDWNEQLLHQQQSKLQQQSTTTVQNPSPSQLPPSKQKLSQPIGVFQQQVDVADKEIGDFLSIPIAASSPSLDTLRHWYRAARELGKAQKYLERITTVANDFKAGKPLTDKALDAMHQDFTSQKQVREVLVSTQKVLKAWGQRDDHGAQSYQGKKYQLQQSENGLTVSTGDRGTIFSYQQERVQTNQLNETDLKAFEAIKRVVERDRPTNLDLENER